jgi:VanZ family protein
MNNRNFRWVLAAYILLIFSLSALPGSSLPNQLFPQWDKVVHFIEYLFLGFLAVNSVEKLNPKLLFFLILGGLAISGIDETWQSFRPGRDSSLLDMLADGLGYICGSFLALKLLSNRRAMRDNG